MNVFGAALAARAYRQGRALRTAAFRHRRLVDEPLAVVPWQLGAEPFSAAALAWGSRPGRPALAVAGEPRNRDLAFAALLQFARWFNPLFEAPARRGAAPQVLVANAATAGLLGRLGRRLAYLPLEGPYAASPDLVKLGRHLLFLWNHWPTPGQQLVVSLTDLLNSHWATSLSDLECESLAALDAFIEPPAGTHGFAAAGRAEEQPVGPLPAGEADADLLPLVEQFNRDRRGSTTPAVVGPLLTGITAHYRRLTEKTWDLLWRCRDRELHYPEARSVARRWERDCRAYAAHLDWMARDGLRRTRQSPRQAAMTLRNLEEAQRLVEAEHACDDPLRMVPYILENKAVQGQVVSLDREHRELAERRLVRRPLVTLLSAEPCLMPAGKELWWTQQPGGREFTVHAITPAAEGGCRVVLKLMTSSPGAPLPAVGCSACFSVHSTAGRWLSPLPPADPWTHRPAAPPTAPAPIEDEEGGEAP
jgi:hypothetical protein